MHEDAQKRPSEGLSVWLSLPLAIVLLLTLCILWITWGGPLINDLVEVNLRDHFDGSTVIGKFMLNGVWLVYLLLGVLVGTIHRASKGLLASGLEELREWRTRHG